MTEQDIDTVAKEIKGKSASLFVLVLSHIFVFLLFPVLHASFGNHTR